MAVTVIKELGEAVEKMKKLPSFDDDAQYEIKVDRAVLLAEPDIYARPSSPRILVSGRKAKTLGDAIIWAKSV